MQETAVCGRYVANLFGTVSNGRKTEREKEVTHTVFTFSFLLTSIPNIQIKAISNIRIII